jgi:invasion protein IalB
MTHSKIVHGSFSLRRVLIVAFSILVSCQAMAQEQQPAQTSKSDLSNQSVASSTTAGWSLVCKALDASKTACEVNNAIYSGDSKQRFVGVTFNQAIDAKKNATAQILAALPHGVRLEAGVKLTFDGGEPIMLTAVTSDAAGLFTRAALNADAVAQASAAKQMSLAFTGLDGKDYSVRIDLQGLEVLLKKAGLL